MLNLTEHTVQFVIFLGSVLSGKDAEQCNIVKSNLYIVTPCSTFNQGKTIKNKVTLQHLKSVGK